MAHREHLDREHRNHSPRSDPAGTCDEDEFSALTVLRLVDTKRNPTGHIVPRERLNDLASRIYDIRRKRAGYFESGLLGEPAWDMLLALFCLPTAQWRKLTVSSLVEAAGVPFTTGLRWSKEMERKGLIKRRPDPVDARRVFVFLSEEGERLMTDYLSAIYHQVVEG